MNIHTRFLALMETLGITPSHADTLLKNLINRYSESHRFYHNLNHIKALLGHFDSVKPLLNHPNAVALAIFYHDVIYDPTQTNNEQQSVAFFQQQLASGLSTDLSDKASQLILATQRHCLTDVSDSDMAYFLDMDLAILGSEPSAYQAYAHAIRQEYSHFCEKDYRQGRVAVLTNFLQRHRLFFSANFFERYETLARQNLQAEIKRLTDYKP